MAKTKNNELVSMYKVSCSSGMGPVIIDRAELLEHVAALIDNEEDHISLTATQMTMKEYRLLGEFEGY